MQTEYEGHLLSVHPDAVDGAVVWLLGTGGERYRFTQTFETTFYIAGETFRLEAVRSYLRGQDHVLDLAYEYRRDLYKGMIRVLRITVDNPVAQQHLFYRLKKRFKRIRFYDANIPFPIRYTAQTRAFPMAKCRVAVDEAGRIQQIEPLDSPWEVEYDLPALRVMTLEPDSDPLHSPPQNLILRYEGASWTVGISNKPRLFQQLKTILAECDPDVIIAPWGDGYTFGKLTEWAEKFQIDFNPSRDPRQRMLRRQAVSYFSYGSVYYRAPQTHLFGRWHIDPENTAMGGGFSLRSAIEMARVTGVSVQRAARNSPGSGFTAMQIGEALRRGVLVPLHKRQTERLKSAMDLNLADSGGLSFRPTVGLHRDVAELDFFSMYPSIMAQWNISGETVGESADWALQVPQTGVPIRQDVPGLVATVLKPLLEKRRRIKAALARMEESDPYFPVLQAMADGLKWLGYVSFGYQGYKNNLFGNIQAHEAITAVGRWVLTTTIEIALEFGWEVLGALTDCVFVRIPGVEKPTPHLYQAFITEVYQRTGQMLNLEGIFQWLAFLPTKKNPEIGATNRYFGKIYNGKLKVRGMAQRRSDTPAWVAAAEREVMALLAGEKDTDKVEALIPDAIAVIRRYLQDLYHEKVPLVELVVSKKLTREIHEYKGKSEPAKAARQLTRCGKEVRVGMRMRLLYVVGEKPGVYAWDRQERPTYAMIDKQRYRDLLLRTMYQVLLPFGMSEQELAGLVIDGAVQLELWPYDEWEDSLSGDWEDELALADILFRQHVSGMHEVRPAWQARTTTS